MKLKNIFMLSGALFLGTVATVSCSEDEAYDFEGVNTNLVYVDQTVSNVKECTIYHTPVGSYGDVSTSIKVRTQYRPTDSLRISAVADNSLVAAYNEENGTQYAEVPEAVVKAAQITTIGIGAATSLDTTSVKVSIPETAYPSLTASEYLLPVRLNVANASANEQRPVVSKAETSVSYIIIHTTNALVALVSNTVNCSVLRTPAGVKGQVAGRFNTSLHYAIGSDVTLSLQVNDNLVSAYNSANNTAYKLLPSELLSALELTSATVEAGNQSGTLTFSVPEELGSQLTAEEGYMLAFDLVATYADGTKQVIDGQSAYVIVTTGEDYIQDSPSSLIGTVQENGDSEWSCIAATNFNKDEFTTSGWAPVGSNLESGSVTIDLGSVHNVSAFKANCYVATSFSISLSTDGKSWKNLGSTSGKSTYRKSYYDRFYVLYAGVAARYVKLDISFNSTSWYWNYASWGYCDLDLNFAFDD